MFCCQYVSQCRQTVIGWRRKQFRAGVMPHQQQCRKMIDGLIKPKRRKGNGADDTKKKTHRGKKPFVQHNASKQERGDNGMFFLCHVTGRDVPNLFQVHIDAPIKIHKYAVYLLMAFQIGMKKTAADKSWF